MALVVVGGQSRNVGKTSVVAGLIAALPQFNWSAMKISQHGHGIYSHGADQDHGWAISEEHDRSESTDTSRFLQAGAHRVWWVRSQPGRLAEAVPTVRNLLADCQHAILESNSILKFLRPDLYLTVLDPDTADFKPTARICHTRNCGICARETQIVGPLLGTRGNFPVLFCFRVLIDHNFRSLRPAIA